MLVPMWPDSDDLPLDRAKCVETHRRYYPGATDEECKAHADRMERIAISQRLDLMRLRGIAPVWVERKNEEAGEP